MTYPAWAWDTSGKTPRRVKVGETISYIGYGRCVTHHICDCKHEELERLRAEVEWLDSENQRLREEVENITSMIVAIGGAGALQAARRRQREEGKSGRDD